MLGEIVYNESLSAQQKNQHPLSYSDSRFARQIELLGSVCGIFACLGGALLCIVVQMGQRTPQQLFFNYNKLQFNDLTTNQVVGSSNLSGRANFQWLKRYQP